MSLLGQAHHHLHDHERLTKQLTRRPPDHVIDLGSRTAIDLRLRNMAVWPGSCCRCCDGPNRPGFRGTLACLAVAQSASPLVTAGICRDVRFGPRNAGGTASTDGRGDSCARRAFGPGNDHSRDQAVMESTAATVG